MKFLDLLALTFFRVFGITQPSPGQTRRASWFILGLLVAVLILLGIVSLTLHRIIGQ